MKNKPRSKVVAIFLSLILPAITIAGCGGNQAPTAYIDSVAPGEAAEGEMVAFSGHGTDADGTVVAYRWLSSIDGEIGTSANVTIIAVPEPVILSFNADLGTIYSGGTSTLSWDMTGAATVSIDQGIGNVALNGTRDVSPSETTIYILTATNDAGSVNAAAQVAVQEDTTPPGTPILISPANGATLPQPDEEWSFDWSDSSEPESGVAGYQLYVIRQGAAYPLIDTFVTDSEYSGIVGGRLVMNISIIGHGR
jgi:hypothetical protein